MFKKWLEENDIRSFALDKPLFPKASDRAFWDRRSDGARIRCAETYLGFEWPAVRASQFMAFNKAGDRIAQENPHFARRAALIALAMGELCEYKGRFIPDLCDGILAVCEETFWGVSAHAPRSPFPLPGNDYFDLFAAETAEIFSVILYMFREELEEYCPAIVERLEYELRRRIRESYLRHTEYGWMGRGYPVNNWTVWIESNVLTVFLLTAPRDDDFYAAIEKIFEETDFWYLSQPEDGGCDEGASYWTRAGGKFFEFCDQLYVASGGAIDFFKDELTKRIGAYEYHAYIGNGWFVDFADGQPRLSADLDWIAYGYGLRTGDERLKALGGEMLKYKKALPDGKAPFDAAVSRENKIKREVYSLMYRDGIASAPAFVPEKSFVLPDLQIAAAREGEWFVAAKGGHNAESHNHNDVGSFIAYYGCEPVLVDPGTGTYTKKSFSEERYSIWTMSGAWHSIPAFGGTDEKNGSEYRAGAFSLEGEEIRISFPGAYPEQAGVRRLDRTVSVGEKGVALEDVVALEEAGEIAERFVTPLEVSIEDGAAILGGAFVLRCLDGAAVYVDSMDFEGDSILEKYWSTDHMNRIVFSAEAKEARLRFVLEKL